MPTTTRTQIPYPAPGDIPDGAAQIQAVAARLESVMAMYLQGTAAAKPAAGTAGRLYLATDTGEVFMDSGSAWVALPSSGSARLHDVGDLKTSIRTTDHGGWLLANGRALAAGVSPSLRAMLVSAGNPYGVTGSDPKIIDAMGKTLVSAGAGAGLTARTVGQSGGAETHTLAVAEMPSHNHGGVTGQDSPDHVHSVPDPVGLSWEGGVQAGSSYNLSNDDPYTYNTGGASARHTHTVSSQGGGGGHNNMPPFVVAQVFIYGG